jgi:hypothetical protein
MKAKELAREALEHELGAITSPEKLPAIRDLAEYAVNLALEAAAKACEVADPDSKDVYVTACNDNAAAIRAMMEAQ